MKPINTGALIEGALALTAALAWNSAVQSGITTVLPNGGKSVPAQFGYALLVTFFVILVAAAVNRFDPGLLDRIDQVATTSGRIDQVATKSDL